jgi:hypothetical protein
METAAGGATKPRPEMPVALCRRARARSGPTAAAPPVAVPRRSDHRPCCQSDASPACRRRTAACSAAGWTAAHRDRGLCCRSRADCRPGRRCRHRSDRGPHCRRSDSRRRSRPRCGPPAPMPVGLPAHVVPGRTVARTPAGRVLPPRTVTGRRSGSHPPLGFLCADPRGQRRWGGLAAAVRAKPAP